MSPQVYEIFGYKSEEIIGLNGFNFIHPEDISNLAKMMEKLIKNGGPMATEYRALHKDGHYVHLSANGTVVRESDDVKLIAILRDISLQKEIQQKLKESEQKYRLITENSQYIVYTLDMNLNNTYISPAVSTVLGYDIDEAFLMHPKDNVIHKDDLKKIGQIYREEFKLERKKDKKKDLNRKRVFIIRERHKDGKILVMEHTISWLRDEKGTAVGILGVAKDITEKKHTEDLLLESEEKYRNLFEKSPYAIGLMDLNGKIIDCNDSQEKIFGYKKEELIGKDFREIHLIPQKFITIVLDGFNRLIKGKNLVPKEIQLYKKDGSLIWVIMQASLIKTQNKTLIQAISQDISILKEVELKLEEKNKELEQLNTLKTEFLRRASHELKTPLVALKANADLIMNLHYEKLTPEVIKMIEEIQRGGERIEDIIHKLIESSKLESSKIELITKKADLSTVIKSCVNELETLIKMRNLTIDLDLKNPMITKFNEDQIHEVISNLLTNAINYSYLGGKIIIKSEIFAKNLIISIKDNGIGFADDEKLKIFQKFGKINRKSQGLDILSEGSGLGLYISKKIVELHGGKIWFESKGYNKGSIFSFTLPII